MGMFDYVVYPETVCEVCGTSVTEYQSKDGKCELNHLTPSELLAQSGENKARFYGYCDLDWNSEPRPHCNDFVITAPQPLKVQRLAHTKLPQSGKEKK